MRRIFLISVGLLMTGVLAGQSPPRVGDEVRYQCFCFGQEWIKAKVEAVSARMYAFVSATWIIVVTFRPIPEVRLGTARNPLETVPMDPLQKS